MSARRPAHHPCARDHAHANATIATALEKLLESVRIRDVHIADDSVPPPMLAYVTAFPRLSVPLAGTPSVELASHGDHGTVTIRRGHAVLVPAHSWDRPQWSRRSAMLTCLFGHRQIGFSLVEHGNSTDDAPTVIKTSVHGAHDSVSRNILQALMTSAVEDPHGRLNPLLVEALLQACLRLLRQAQPPALRKATLTYEAICLYVAEHFQDRGLNRESVAAIFELAPNHISRLFAAEGSSRFNDHLNIVRVNRAKFILQNYRMSVKEIAANCGYSDAAYFCRVFRKATGLTPQQYRTGHARAANVE